MPVNRLRASPRFSSSVRFPSSEGIVPVNPLLVRPRLVTRLGSPVVRSVPTPYHPVTGPLLNQLLLLSQFAPSVAS